MKEAHCTIHGMVQGVWYRAWTVDMARETGVSGWVRNCDDGTVETVAQGDKVAVTQFIERLHEGPPLARVSRVDVTWRDPDGLFGRFQTRT
jgi:acylphosphatase